MQSLMYILQDFFEASRLGGGYGISALVNIQIMCPFNHGSRVPYASLTHVGLMYVGAGPAVF
jgi:hypothetical protein